MEFPSVLTWDAVRSGAMPPLGESGLPDGLERDVPGAYRYWKCTDPDDARAVRDALVESGLLAPETVREVVVRRAGGDVTQTRRVSVVEEQRMVVQDADDGEPVVPSARAVIDKAAELAGVDPDAIRFGAQVVDVFGFRECLDRALAGQRDFIIEMAEGSSALDELAVKVDRSTAFRLLGSDAAVYYASGIPDDGVRWAYDPPDAAAALRARQNLRAPDIAALVDQLAVPEAVADVAEAVAVIAAKSEFSKSDNRWASRALTLLERELAKGDGANGDVLRGLGVDVCKARTDVVDRVSEISIRKFSGGVEERIVYGVVLEPGSPDDADLQGHYVTKEDIRAAAHHYMEHFGTLGLQHKEVITGRCKILESFIAPVDFVPDGAADAEVIKAGSWVLCERVIDDELWTAIRRGEITGFSIGGTGRLVPA